MNKPVFLHIQVNERACIAEMHKIFKFMQYYPGTTARQPELVINTPHMIHFFRTPDRLKHHAMDGLKLVGYDRGDGVLLDMPLMEYLDNRVSVYGGRP